MSLGDVYWSYASLQPHDCTFPFLGALAPGSVSYSQASEELWFSQPSLSLLRVCFQSQTFSARTLQLMKSMETAEATVHGLAPGAGPRRAVCRGHCCLEWSWAGQHMPSLESQGGRGPCR